MPIKRHAALVSLSKEHHYGLLLCWKIRQGINKNIEILQIKQYALWFWNNHLMPHFQAEEQYVFPVLPNNNPLRLKATEEHQHIAQFFEPNYCNTNLDWLQLAQCLDDHIRFEERVLFPEIEKIASTEQLATIEKAHKPPQPALYDNWADAFWKNS